MQKDMQKKTKKDRKMAKVGLQIRFEVMNILNRNPLKQIKLPSAQELADRFGISRRSVTQELKKLIGEGWIIGVRGSGTFTNPERSIASPYLPTRKIIGLLCAGSRQFYYDYNYWAFLTLPGLAMIPKTGYPHIVQLTDQDPDSIYKELYSHKLDGILWSWPPDYAAPVLRRLRKEGVAVATMLKELKGVPGIQVNYKQCGREIAEILKREKREKIFWCAFDDFARERMIASGFRIPPGMIAENLNEFHAKMEHLLADRTPPDAIYLHGDSLYLLDNLFRKYNRDPYDGQCRLIAGWSIAKAIPEFRGIVRKYPYEALSQAGVELLYDQFSGKTCGSKTIKMEIRSIG